MENQKNHLLPSNYVTIVQLKERWLEEKEQRLRELEKPEEQNRDQRQEIQSGEMSEEVRLMKNLNLHALKIDSQVQNLRKRLKPKRNRFTSVKNQGMAEASLENEEQLVVDVELDGPPHQGSENKANKLGLAVEGKKQSKNKKKKKKKKKKQTTAVVEKNPKSEGESKQDQNGELAVKLGERIPEVNGKKIRGRGRNTDEKKGIENDEYGPNSGNVDRILEIRNKSRHFSIHDGTKTEDNRFLERDNEFREGYRNARVNVRFNRQDVQKEKGGALVWVRKGEISSEASYGFHSRVAGGSINGPSGKQERLNK